MVEVATIAAATTTTTPPSYHRGDKNIIVKECCIASNSLSLTPSTCCDSASDFELPFSSSFSDSFPELAESYLANEDDEPEEKIALTSNRRHQHQARISKDRTPKNSSGSKSKTKGSTDVKPTKKELRKSGEKKSKTFEQDKKCTGRRDKKHISRANNRFAKKEQDLQNAIDILLETSSSTSITMTSSSSSSSFQRRKTKPTRHTKAYDNRMERSSLKNNQSRIPPPSNEQDPKHVSWKDNDRRCDRRRTHKVVRKRSRCSYSSERNQPKKIHSPRSREKLHLEAIAIRHSGKQNHDRKTKTHNKRETMNNNNVLIRKISNAENENKETSNRRLFSEQQSCPFFFENLWDEENDMAPPSFYDTDKPMGKTSTDQMTRLSSSFEDLFYDENSILRPSKDKSEILVETGSETKKKSMRKKKTTIHHSECTKQSSMSSSISKRGPNVLTAHAQKPHGAAKKSRSRRSSTFGKLQHFLRSIRA